MILFLAHLALAALLFFFVNLVGRHSITAGYGSTTLFEEPNESLALNFFIRALAPSVFIVALAAAAVAAGYPHLRLGLFDVAILYYGLRAAYIFAFNLQRLVSWPRYFLHAGVGIGAAWLAYRYLVVPNRSLLPEIDELGNELWLGILAFLYAAANRVTMSGDPGDRRRNSFIQRSFDDIKARFGCIVDGTISDDRLRLVAYAILVYESYCRPPFARALERICFWKKTRTTGVMQIAAERPLGDEESVQLGTAKLLDAWKERAGDENPWSRVFDTITDYNFDSTYRSNIMDVMEIIAKRSAPQEFGLAYRAIMGPE